MLLPSGRTPSQVMNWIVLVLAGLCECGFTFCLGKANIAAGGRQVLWYAIFVILYALSMVLLAKAVKTIPIGTAYPVWTGIGAVGTVLLGKCVECWVFGETISAGMATEIAKAKKRGIPIRYFTEDMEEVRHSE